MCDMMRILPSPVADLVVVVIVAVAVLVGGVVFVVASARTMRRVSRLPSASQRRFAVSRRDRGEYSMP